MNDVNKAVDEYLRHYCEDTRSFDYAVMLSGPWGAGKTYFVENFFAKHKIKNLYVSLYGMTATRQIEEEFWRLLHPVLSSKPMKLLSALGKGFLKGTIKIDLDRDGKEDGSLAPSAPDIDVVKFANPTGHVLVFDDLERCRMPLDEVLGYINSLVEHSGFKVVIIANEMELIKLKNEKYPEIKEKLVGQTLEVRSSVEEALNEFLDNIANENVFDHLKKNRSIVVETYRASESDNLRALKHALWDFERFAATFPRGVWKKREVANWLLRVTLALAIEFRLGRISRDEIIDLFQNKMTRLVERSSLNRNGGHAQLSRIEALEKRHSGLSFDQGNYDGRVIANGLQKGWFEPEAVKKGFEESIFLVKRSDRPAWRTVWSMLEVDDDEFISALMKMEEQFRRRAFLVPGEILHVAGLRLFLAGENILTISRCEVVAEVKAYIDELLASARLEEGRIDEHLSHCDTWDGLGIFEAGKLDYREVFQYLQSSMSRALEVSLPEKAKRLAVQLSKDPDAFIAKIVSHGNENEYRRIPILKHIEVRDFLNRIMGLPAPKQRRIMAALKGRYDYNLLNSDLASELPWLAQLRDEMLGRVRTMSGIGKWRLAKLVEWNLDPLLSDVSRADQLQHVADSDKAAS